MISGEFESTKYFNYYDSAEIIRNPGILIKEGKIDSRILKNILLEQYSKGAFVGSSTVGSCLCTDAKFDDILSKLEDNDKLEVLKTILSENYGTFFSSVNVQHISQIHNEISHRYYEDLIKALIRRKENASLQDKKIIEELVVKTQQKIDVSNPCL